MSNFCVSSEILGEINERKKNNVTPSVNDKDQLLYKINKQLDEEDHAYIFTELLQKMKKKIYTITENCTLFDLNDLDNDTFWSMYYYVQIFIDNHDREKVISDVNKDNNILREKHIEQFNCQLGENKENNDVKVDQSNMTEYERLRIDALSTCNYSNYSANNDTFSDENIMDNKIIYSDNCQFKWKQLTKSDEIAKKLTRISSKQDSKLKPQEILKNEEDNDEDDELDELDDTEEDDNDIMTNDEPEIKQYTSKPKLKLLLKQKPS